MTNRLISLEKKWRYFLIFCMILSVFQAYAIGAQGTNLGKEEADQKESLPIEERWGIKVIGIQLTAEHHMLDFRYRVIDPDKAWSLLQKQVKPLLINEATGEKLVVPRTKLGPLRQTAVKPETNRDYRILFGNTGKKVKAGDRVTVVMGDFRVENLVVK
jgi:hypothetical protein